MNSNAMVENCVTLVAAAAVILGVYAMGGGGFCLAGLFFLLNLNYPAKRKAE